MAIAHIAVGWRCENRVFNCMRTSGIFPIINLGVEFDELILSSFDSSNDVAWQKWQTLVEARAPEYFLQVIGGSRRSGYFDKVHGSHEAPVDWARDYQDRFISSLPHLRKFHGQIVTEFTNFAPVFWRTLDAFSGLFPDIGIVSTPVYAVPSLLGFCGQCSDVEGRPVLSFGADLIAILRIEPTFIRGMKAVLKTGVLCAHEILHLYHFHKSGISYEKLTAEGTFLHLAWIEGLATHVSGAINRGSSAAELLFNSELAEACQNRMGQLMSAFVQVADCKISQSKDRADCLGWFQLQSSSSTIPSNAGYGVGLEIVQRASKSYPLAKMLDWNFNEIPQRVRQFIY